MARQAPEGLPDREVPFQHIAVVEGGYFDGQEPPEVQQGDLVVTRYGDFAVEVFEVDEDDMLVGYDKEDEHVRFRVLPGDLLDMTAYHNALLEVDGRTDKIISVSENGRHVSMFDRPNMS